MLSGTPPFYGRDERHIQTKILTCNYGYEGSNWESISPKAKNWIDSLLELTPGDRATPEQALAHEWLSDKHSAYIKYQIHPVVLTNLRECYKPHYLHYEMLNIFTQFLDDSDVKAIRETFQSLDQDNSGSIEIDELRHAYEKINKLSKEGKLAEYCKDCLGAEEPWEYLPSEKIE
mmetsp:Transcript_17233/g.29021  ORF Transcript_17233/g.29021 Transcript_17233/m.29021 type:complete len:175 (+) Transcript_17233:547-1071(+)